MTQPRLACLFTACAVWLGCGGSADKAADAGAKPEPEPELDFSTFDSLVEGFVADEGLEGATAVIVHRERGVVHHQAYGAFDVEQLHLVASCSKILSAGVLLALSDEDKLDLEAPLSDYVSDWGDHKPGLTTAQLLSNSSGLVALLENTYYAPYVCQFTLGGKVQTCAKQIYTAKDTEDLIPPDTKFKYGGAQWQLAGGIAEVVSGKAWADLVQETYAACDVPSLGFGNQFQQASNDGGSFSYPSFFQGDPSNLIATKNPNIEGGAYITSGDYGKILLMHLRGGLCGKERVLSEAAVARMQEDRIAKAYDGSTGRAELEGYGMGWWVERGGGEVRVDPGLYGATAWLDNKLGYAAFIVIEADEDTGERLYTAARPLIEQTFSNAED